MTNGKKRFIFLATAAPHLPPSIYKFMPRRKTPKIDFDREILSIEPPKSYKSLMYGVLTVFIFFVLVFVGLKIISQRNAGMITDESAMTSQGLYVVQKGDSLWTIAVAKYGDGYKWVEIAKANNLSNPSKIEAGMRIIIPDINMAIAITEFPSLTVEPPTSTPAPTRVPAKEATPQATTIPAAKAPKASPAMQPSKQTVPDGKKISGNSYTVVKGDYLWDIAIRAYGDGYKWVDIARANKLANPDIIHSGNKFIIPR